MDSALNFPSALRNEAKPGSLKAGLFASDIESTLVPVEGLDEIGGWRSDDVRRQIEEITNQGMSSGMDFKESLQKRLDILKITQEDLDRLARLYVDRLTDTAKELIAEARRRFERVVVISGGLKQPLMPMVEEFGLHPVNDLFAIEMTPEFEVSDSPLLRNDGKKIIFDGMVQELGLNGSEYRHFMIGDGKTDAAVRSEKNYFAAIKRFPNIEKQGDSVISDLAHAKVLIESQAWMFKKAS